VWHVPSFVTFQFLVFEFFCYKLLKQLQADFSTKTWSFDPTNCLGDIKIVFDSYFAWVGCLATVWQDHDVISRIPQGFPIMLTRALVCLMIINSGSPFQATVYLSTHHGLILTRFWMCRQIWLKHVAVEFDENPFSASRVRMRRRKKGK
jgi:hypothetical protein